MIVLDAEDQVLGRLCSIAAKKALLGEEVVIVNAEKALVSGEKKTIIREGMKKLTLKNKGNYRRGPFHYKNPDRYVRKKVRGMLPYHKDRGRQAFKRIQVYTGVPEKTLKKAHGIDLEKNKPQKISGSQKNLRRSMSVGEICKHVGGN